jgi:UDP-N-acetylglucosamine--N-acetylmuramyl-(pentapeptide) pyrophosphoryl-undecaprenol N-acetylglucosamine transferase
MKLLIVAGGGGHFAAALAVIDALPKEWKLLIIGRKYAFEHDKALSFEYQLSKQRGLPFAPLITGRLQRKFTKYSLVSFAKMPIGFFQALHCIQMFKPDKILSFGGYVSLPVAFAAKILGVPIIIHEQTLGAGLSNKIVGKFAEIICISWEQSRKFFPKEKTILTGNPLRKEFLEIADSTKVNASHKEKTIYITGGSTGAHAMNVFVEGCLEQLLTQYQIIHQTGDAKEFDDFNRLMKLRQSFPSELSRRYLLKKFVSPEEVAQTLNKADLIVSRAGIGTITELLFLGKPSLLIPLPFGQHNEQQTNALFVKKIGLAKILDQQKATSQILFDQITIMLQNLTSYTKQRNVARQLVSPKATQSIISLLAHEKS